MQKLALGTVQFGIDYGVGSTTGKVGKNEVGRILKYANSKGLNFLDTAPAYGDSEKILGSFDINSFNVVTKTRSFNNSKINQSELKTIANDFYQSLENLNQDSIYGILVHDANDLLKIGSEAFFNKLNDLKKIKKIKKIGVSVYDSNQLQHILENFDIDLVQIPFNILDKRMINNGLLSVLNKKGIEVHARSVFLQGLLLMSDSNRPDKFKQWDNLWKVWRDWLGDNKINALEASIRYALSISEISKVLVGVDTKDQLREIIVASSGAIPNIPNELFTDDVNLLNPSNWTKL